MAKKIQPPGGQGPAIQFRPGPELERAVASFGRSHGLSVNESGKALVALAVCGMDARHYEMVSLLAKVMGGRAFAHACLHVRAGLEGAAIADRRTSRESLRTCVVLNLIWRYVETEGSSDDLASLRKLLETLAPNESQADAADPGARQPEHQAAEPAERWQAEPEPAPDEPQRPRAGQR